MDKTAENTMNETVENTAKKTVDKVIAIALAEEGYLEKSKKAYNKNHEVLDSKKEGAGSDNYTKYGRDMNALYPKAMDFAAPWCDCFVDWCFYQAYGVTNAQELLGGNFDDYTKNSAKLYEKKNAWHTEKPQVGDQIFFKNKKGICHTGLVYKVAKGYVYTIEGNTSSAQGVVANGGCVSKKSYSIAYDKIAGYGRPKYDGQKETRTESEIPGQGDTWHNLVVNLQKALNAEYDAQLVVDGIAGRKTLNATPTLNVSIRSTRPKTVKAFQSLLTYWGYKCLVDGDFYTATEKKAKSFQEEIVGIAKPDGEFTAKKKSWKALLNLK